MTPGSQSAPARFRLRRVRTLADRVRAMHDLVTVGLRDPEMRRLALAVAAGDNWTIRDLAERHRLRPFDLDLRSCPARDDLCELSNIYTFVKRNVRYSGDLTPVDTYTTARRTLLEMRAGDCDDAFVSTCTLAVHNGFGFVARCVASPGAVDRGRPVIGHIYGVALVPKFKPRAGVALDTTLPTGTLGTEPTQVQRVDFRAF